MASLKELEEDLKRQIEKHGSPYNNEITDTIQNLEKRSQTLMVVREHGQPFYKLFSYSRMAIKEHGQPYKKVWYDIEGNPCSSYKTKLKSDNIISNKKYDHIRKNGMCVTKMAVRQHGQPFKAVWYDTEGNPHIVQSKMVIREHGQPYRNTSSEKNTC